MRLTPVGKIVVLLIVVGVAVGIWRSWSKIAPPKADKPAVAVNPIELPDQAPNTSSSGSVTPVVASEGGCTDKPEVRILGYAWNAQMGMHLANGGARAAKGSIMCRNGVNLLFQRQDDNSKLQEALVSFATELKRGNPNPSRGAHFMTMMGDGSAAFLAGLNGALGRLGDDYKAKIVGAIGYSRGEDKFMGPPDWKADPSTSKGGVVAGVLRDGDWNIAMKWLADNGLKTNPDEKTWDPDALNWIAANDYIDAAEKYVNGYTETRDVVRNGVKTGEKKTIKVDGVVTWTPGDVTIAEKKGGLVSIVSTKEYASQMPCVVIGIDKWMKQNPQTVQNMLAAIAEGGELVKTSEAGLKKAAKISAEVYKEETPEYWAKYFRPVYEKDKTGLDVELGGSSVNNLADSLLAFGLVPGSANLVAATYTVFGDVVKAQYPELVPNYPPANTVIDTSYLRALQKRTAVPKIKPVTYKPAAKPGRRISTERVNINFNPNSANFTPQAQAVLERVARNLLVASGTTIEIHGHTDNQGNNPGKSMTLSKARSLAVKAWLERRAPVNFPQGRIQAQWHGESKPVDPRNNPQAWAKNRRVEIVLRSAS
jgi:OmpA-OmpF porin, OOP family